MGQTRGDAGVEGGGEVEAVVCGESGVGEVHCRLRGGARSGVSLWLDLVCIEMDGRLDCIALYWML